MSRLDKISTRQITVQEDESLVPQVLRRFFIFDLHLPQHLFHLWQNRYLLYALTLRGIRGRYKQSLLGVGWALLTPAAMTAVFTYVMTRSQLINKVHFPCPFPVYALFMLTFWNFFQRGVTNGSTALVSNMDLVTKVYFPREVLPMASVLMNLVDWLVAFGMFLVVAFVGTRLLPHLGDYLPMLAMHFDGSYVLTPSWEWAWGPVLMLCLGFFIMGVVFFASTLQVYFRDIAHLISLGLFLWLFLTPVLYPLRALAGGRATSLIIINPMTGLLDGLKLAIVSNQSPLENHVLYACAFSVALFILGYSFFKHEERYFADVV